MGSVIVFLIGAGLLIPIGVILCRLYKPFMYVIFAAFVISTITLDWSITFVSRELYKSATRGFEIHQMDLLALVLGMAMWMRPREYRLKFALPLLIPYTIYIAVAFASWAVIEKDVIPNRFLIEILNELPTFELRLFPLFELSKIFRGLFAYWVLVNFIQDKTAYKVLLASLGGLIIYLTCDAVISRYIFGEHRVQVVDFHVNDFNAYVGMMGLFVFAFALQSKIRLKWSLLGWFIMVCALLSIVLTVSRSSLAGFLVGGVVVYGLMLLYSPSVRNILITALAMLCVVLIFGKAVDSLMQRFSFRDNSASFDMRTRLNNTAMLMADDHPLGVGMGNFMAYNISQYGEMTGAEKSNIAHNVWFLTLGELGYPGLIAFSLIWLRFYQLILSALIRSREDPRWYVHPALVGALGASVVLQFQNCFHFSYRQTSVYFLMIIFTAVAVRMYLSPLGRRYSLLQRRALASSSV